MKVVPTDLQNHLNTRETTLAWCWKITRTDGEVLGFTNHDRQLSFDGTDYEASTGMLGTEIESSLGLSVDNMDVEGAVDSVAITEADLIAGKFDDASIDLYLVNWADVSQRMLMKTGNLGQIKRGKVSFQAEVRGLAARLQQRRGRLYQYACDAKVGDSRCTVNLESGTYKGSGTVTSTDGSVNIVASGLGSYTNGWFSRGRLTWTSGNNDGETREVKIHSNYDGVVSIILWAPTAQEIQNGDTFEVRAGCDKMFATCKAKFNNAVNFRGFPHMPGQDFVIFYPNGLDRDLDGGGRFNGED